MLKISSIKEFIIRCMPDRVYLAWTYKKRMGKKLNLRNPKTLNEKLNWLKLYNRNPIYTTMVDKYEVKNFVSNRIGAEHVVQLYGVYDSFDEIDFTQLPNQFVLKCTHDSGGYIVCKDKAQLNIEDARKKIEPLLKKAWYSGSREWAYKNVKPRIIAERYIDSLGKHDSYEYKLTCCNGIVKIITICTGIAHDKIELRTNDNFDRNLNHQPWYAIYKNSLTPVKLPDQLDEMIAYAEILAKDIPYVRVDFYIHDGIVYFGEFTFYTWGGFIQFSPEEWDLKLGQLVTLPKNRKK